MIARGKRESEAERVAPGYQKVPEIKA